MELRQRFSWADVHVFFRLSSESSLFTAHSGSLGTVEIDAWYIHTFRCLNMKINSISIWLEQNFCGGSEDNSDISLLIVI